MSGGQLVVMDRTGRDIKRYSLPEGLVTLGSDQDCDIRVLLPAIKEHHATVIVHANQTVVRNVSDGETLVNGHAVSVAALRHGDVITLGDRSLRWEYYEPEAPRPLAPEPALYVKKKVKGRGRKRASEIAPRRLEPAVRLALEMKHRASIPGATKQVAIVQPQRRDNIVDNNETKTRLVTKPHRPYSQNKRMSRTTKSAATRSPQNLRNLRNRTSQSLAQNTSSNKTDNQNILVDANVSNSEHNSNTSLRGKKKKVTPNKNISPSIMLNSSIIPKNFTPKQSLNNTENSYRMSRKLKSLRNSDSPKDKTPKSRNSKSFINMTTNSLLETSTETKASQWIASRKSSPRKSNISKSEETKSIKYVHVATPRPKAPYVEKTPSKMLASSTPRKVLPKRNAPLRTAVLRKTVSPNIRNKSLTASTKKLQSVLKTTRVQKIEEPLKIDDHKKAALMLLTRTPKSRLSSSKTNVKQITPALVVQKYPVRCTPRSLQSKGHSRGTPSPNDSPTMEIVNTTIDNSKKRVSVIKHSTRNSRKLFPDSGSSKGLNISNKSPSPRENQSIISPPLPSPRKSAMKNPNIKKAMKKIDSIKFDLSNIEHNSQDESESLIINKTYEVSNDMYTSEDDLTLRYSESPSPAPSPRKSIHSSRSTKIMEKTLGETFSIHSPEENSTTKSVAPSPSPRKSLRSSSMVQKALEESAQDSNSSLETSINKSLRSNNRFVGDNTPSKNRSVTMETYSIVDLVSLDTNEGESVIDLASIESGISPSVYDSAASDRGSVSTYHGYAMTASQRSSPRRRTYTTMSPSHIGTSTPYVAKTTPQKSMLTRSRNTTAFDILDSTATLINPKRSKSMENLSLGNMTRRTYSTDKNCLAGILKSGHGDTLTKTISPRSSKKKRFSSATIEISQNATSKTSSLRQGRTKESKNNTISNISQTSNEPSTPPEFILTTGEACTPVLNIQNLLDASNLPEHQLEKQHNQKQKNKRRTIGLGITKTKNTAVMRGAWTEPKRNVRTCRISKVNLNSVKKVLKGQLEKPRNDSCNATNKIDEKADDENTTPKSTVKLVQPGVKERHSTAKKPVSKRSLIDDLTESDTVKQLFNSPVKRKLSQSMMEFRKSELCEESVDTRKRKRVTTALSGRTPDKTLDFSYVNTPQVPTEMFISPVTTPNQSPNLSGVKRLFAKNSPANDLRNVKGLKRLLRTPRKQKSPHNDLTNVTGVKTTFTKRSPTNDLTDVRGVKHLYALERNQSRVSGVRNLFGSQTNDKSPKNDLRNIEGVKDLSDTSSINNSKDSPPAKRRKSQKSPEKTSSMTRGTIKALRTAKLADTDLDDSSEAEELFNVSSSTRSHFDSESVFDHLIGKPKIKATYSKSLLQKSKTPPKNRKAAKSLLEPIDFVSMNVEEWLEREFQKRIHQEKSIETQKSQTMNISQSRTIKNLVTDTVEGRTPIIKSRSRSSTLNKSLSRKSGEKSVSDSDRNLLPLKKRSVANVSEIVTEKVLKHKVSLPIKKHTIEHSTPVKGTRTLAINVSEFSPIINETVEENQPQLSIVTPSKNTKTVGAVSKPIIKRATRKTKAIKGKIQKSSDVEIKVTRTRRGTQINNQTNKKKPPTSLILKKSSPILSPQVISADKTGLKSQTQKRGRRAKANKTNVEVVSAMLIDKKLPSNAPKTKRGKRTENAEKKQSPTKDSSMKNQRETRTRARNKRKSSAPAVIVTKPSPKIKPPKKQINKLSVQESPIKAQIEPKKRTRRTPNDLKNIQEPVQDNQKRTRRTQTVKINISSPKRDKKGKIVTTLKESPVTLLSIDEPKRRTRGRAENNVNATVNAKTRASHKTQIKLNVSVEKSERGRKRNVKAVTVKQDAPKKARTTVEIVDSEPKQTRSRHKKLEESPVKVTNMKTKKGSPTNQKTLQKGRKRFADPIKEPVQPRRGKKPTKQDTVEKPKKKQEKANVPSPVKTRATRGQKKIVESEVASGTRRGRRQL